jgi:hypothetical protein
VLDHVNRRDTFSIKKPFLSSARGAGFPTKQASNVNVVRVVLLDVNSYLAYWSKAALTLTRQGCEFIHLCLFVRYKSLFDMHLGQLQVSNSTDFNANKDFHH